MSKKIKKKKTYSKNKKKTLIEGIVRINQRGFGFLQVSSPVRISYLIAHHEMPALMEGDRLSCSLVAKDDKTFAKPEEILERAHRTLSGRLVKGNDVYFEAHGNLPRPRFLIEGFEKKKWGRETPDTLFRAEILTYPTSDDLGTVRIVHAIGEVGALSTEISLLMGAIDVDTGFPYDVLAEASSFKEDPDEAEIAERKDLTPLSFCTIDGETAKDFDDAVFAQNTKEGVRVKVAIADVSHYVKPGSFIDEEAYRRGSSLYYAGSCQPMIPEQISNGLCSLKPLVPRLVMVADFVVAKDGAISAEKFYRAVIRSKARLTYKQVQEHRDGAKVEAIVADKHLVTSLKQVYEASARIRKAREGRGAIDFDSTESHIALNDKGEPISIHPEQRLASHKVIEDLMIAANEAVARCLESKKAPCLYRVHEAPDLAKFESFVKLAEAMGVLTAQDAPTKKELKDPKVLSNILAKVRAHSAKEALEMLFLRSMMQARYSSENIGHFGLASKSYSHFTSPIRRYPDLVVHRALQKFLEGKKALGTKKKDFVVSEEDAADMALYLSERERKVVETERNIMALFACWYMKDKIGEEDEGTVVSCTEFGMFVRLNTFHVDGLVHISALGNDEFDFDSERFRLVGHSSKISYGIGDQVRVTVASVNTERRHIDLHLANAKPEARTRERDSRFDQGSRLDRAALFSRSSRGGKPARGERPARVEGPAKSEKFANPPKSGKKPKSKGSGKRRGR